MGKPSRFGVNTWHSPSRAAWAKARKLEDLGSATLVVPDHLTELFVPLTALVSAAEATTHLRVGTHVLNKDLRHPVLVARLAEAVTVIKRLLMGEQVTLTGQLYQVSEHQGYPRSDQRPHPPVLIGGNGRQLLTRSTQQADIVGLTGLP